MAETNQGEINGIWSITMGTQLYTIPLKPKYILKQQFPLEVVQYWDGNYVIFCPAFDEYGYGNDFYSALLDLGSSIVDFWKSLRKLIKREKNLSIGLRRVLNLMEEVIIEKRGIICH